MNLESSLTCRAFIFAVALVASPFAPAQAVITLSGANGGIVQTSDAAWTLTKTGVKDTTNSTVTWTITATKASTKANQLVVDGYVAVTNTGTKGATVGNIVVNLQTKSGSQWVTASSDVNDATSGDVATKAEVDPKASSEGLPSFAENSASGSLQFMDAHSNTLFSLTPEVTIAPGSTVNLLFQAWFDNTALKLAVGAPIRAEVIVSFGNAKANNTNSAAQIDINGNGEIDADEAWVRSVPARLGLTVPAPTLVNSSPTLTDTASNIASTGSVTFWSGAGSQSAFRQARSME